jgi:hypothetical protein
MVATLLVLLMGTIVLGLECGAADVAMVVIYVTSCLSLVLSVGVFGMIRRNKRYDD